MTKYDIMAALLTVPDMSQRSSEQLVCRCILCGDSKKDPNKKRMGILITENPKEPIVFNCFNCFESGYLTPAMLHEFGIYDPDMDVFLQKLNHNANADDGTRVSSKKKAIERKIELPDLQTRDISKVKYLYDRIKHKIPFDDFNELKIVWNLWDLIDVNKIPYDKNKIPMIDILSKDYLGFLTANNDYIILRDTTNNPKNKRYVKYELFKDIDNSNSYYMIKNKIDIMTPEDIHIIVAEGIFDVLGIRYNLFHGDMENKLYVALCTGTFTRAVQRVFEKGLVGDNIHVDCYQDNDTRFNFKKLKSFVEPYILNDDNFHVFYNRKSKDFGVESESMDVDEIII